MSKAQRGGLVALGIGVLVLGLGIFMLRSGWRVRSWPTTPGRVTARGVTEDTQPVGPAGRHWRPEVGYSYVVEGREYAGTRISPATVRTSREEAERRLAEIPETVEVRYDPADPKEAYLEPDSLVWPLVALGMAAVLILSGVGLVVFGRRS